MSVAIAYAYYSTTWSPDQVEPEGEYKTAKKVGKAVAAFVAFGGILTLYALSIAGTQGVGPLGAYSFNINMAICGTLGSLDALIITGLVLRQFGFGAPATEGDDHDISSSQEGDDQKSAVEDSASDQYEVTSKKQQSKATTVEGGGRPKKKKDSN